MASPGVVDASLTDGVLTAYRDAEERLIALMAAKTKQGLDAPEWAKTRLTVVQEYRKQAERIATTAAGKAADAAAASVQVAYNAGHVAAVAELSEMLRPGDTSELGGRVDLQAMGRLQAEARTLMTAPAAGMVEQTAALLNTITAEALAPAMLGADTRRSMAQQALDRMADRGITGFTDRAGRRWALDGYVEMAMRTQLTNATIAGHTARLQQYGHDLVVVSSHMHHCDLCAPYEGKVLSLSGSVVGAIEQTSVLDGSTVGVNVYSSMDDARAAGLLHPNCRHTYAAYQPGMTDLAFGNRYDPEGYQHTQDLRYLERGVRRWKRRVEAALDPQSKAVAQAKVREWQARIREHVATTGIPRASHREQITHGRIIGRGGAKQVAQVQAPKGRALSQKTSRQLQLEYDTAEQQFTKAMMAGDMDGMDKWIGHMERAESAQKTALAREAVAKERYAVRRAEKQAAQMAEYDRLLAEGVEDRQAWAKATGRTVESIRREEVIASLRGDGYTGAGFDELSANAYRVRVAEEYVNAENATRGELVKAKYRDAPKPPDERHLWTRNEAWARKHASDELLEYWDTHGRITLAEYRRQLLEGTGTTYMGEDFLR